MFIPLRVFKEHFKTGQKGFTVTTVQIERVKTGLVQNPFLRLHLTPSYEVMKHSRLFAEI